MDHSFRGLNKKEIGDIRGSKKLKVNYKKGGMIYNPGLLRREVMVIRAQVNGFTCYSKSNIPSLSWGKKAGGWKYVGLHCLLGGTWGQFMAFMSYEVLKSFNECGGR